MTIDHRLVVVALRRRRIRHRRRFSAVDLPLVQFQRNLVVEILLAVGTSVRLGLVDVVPMLHQRFPAGKSLVARDTKAAVETRLTSNAQFFPVGISLVGSALVVRPIRGQHLEREKEDQSECRI